ncbi:MAG TPA: hypothetical protein IAA74_09660 [Candidatus Excrementavichristensenella intestinipullorum]|nr:hypothetical protein [Candidatus Excrementavichristensenella intestinipullorum]
MNAEAITSKILEDARAQAAAALGEAQRKADDLRRRDEAAIEEKRQQSEAQADRQAAEMRDRMLRMAELDQKKALLSVKRQVIDLAFADALERMAAMGAEQKREYIEKLLLASAQGGEELIPSAEDKALFDPAFMARLNAQLQKAGKAAVTLSSQDRPLGGGFVLKQGGLEINCAFSAVLSQARSALEAEVAAVLFN